MRKQRQNYNSNGKTRRKGGLGNGESSGHSKNPNGGPFQNELLRDALEDIFPELRDHGNVNRSNKSQQQQAQVESGSVLGQMIRRRYLLERKSRRTSLDAMIQEEKSNEYPVSSEFNRNNGDFHNHDTPTPPMSTTTKKKRKRKKKKRQESSASVPPSVISHEHTFHSAPLPFSSPRNEIDTHFTDGKSMMSTTDHSLEALDEALKNEAEKMIELQANHELPLLHSLPSDDNIQDPESPSQFIDQIKPQEEDLLRQLPDHTDPLPLSDATENIIPSTLPEDGGDGNEDSLELIWKNPLQLPYLVTVQGEEEHYRYSGYDTQVKSGDYSGVPERPKNVTTFISDKERARILLYDWIDQYFFMNDECECIESTVEKNGQDDCDSQKEEWDSFLQFCNERTVGREKALGIPLAHLLDICSSIEESLSREQTIAEIKTLAGIETSTPSSSVPTAATKSSRIVMKPIPETDDVDVDAAFDYVALEEGHHIAPEEEKSDSNLSFLATDVSIDSKQKKSAGKNGNRKKNPAGSTVATERYLFLETLTFKQIEEYFNEWLIAGVDEMKMAKSSIYYEKEQCESDIDKIFPVVISDVELEVTQRWVIQEQQTFAEALDNMNNGLDEVDGLTVEWKRKNTDNLSDFAAMVKINKCEETCNEYLTKHILDHLTRDISIPTHACAELQIHVWTVYLEGLGKMLNACDEYYKRLEEEFTDQNGAVENFFVHAGLRESYRQLAEEKIGSLSDMGKSLSKVTSSWSMREFFTRSFWEHRKRADQDKKSQELDEDCEKLIEALTDWTKIVPGGRISAIMRERSKGLITVFNMLRVVVESLGEEYKVVEGYFSQDRQNYFSRLLSNIHLAHGVKKKMRLLEMDDVISLTTGVILMWRHVRIMQSRVDRTLSAEILPLSLHKWILDSSTIDLKLEERYQLNPHVIRSKFCDGRHRVMGILAGLTYGWLRERCKEWKAEKASKELLTYIDADLFSGEDPQPSTKSSKKSKKKKNKKSSSVSNESTNNPAVGPEEENDAAKSNDTNSELVKPEIASNQHIIVVESTEVAKQELADGMEIPIAIASIDHGPIFDSHTISGEEMENEDVLTTNESTRSVGSDHVDFPHSDEEAHDDIETFESLVVVKDEGGSIVPAMKFLTERLLELMAQSDNEKIVVVSH